MKTVVPSQAFVHLTTEEILAALAAYEEDEDWDADELDEGEATANAGGEDESEDEDEDEGEEEDPIVCEVDRLVNAYAARLDAYCREHGEVPEEALLYKPTTPIEQIAFQIFSEALQDALMDEGDD
ncbi:MAG: hypothetical protein RRY20_04600 [Bilophila sp.]